MFNQKQNIQKLIEGIDKQGNIQPVVYKLLVESIYKLKSVIWALVLLLFFSFGAIAIISYLWANEQKQFLAYEFNSTSNMMYRVLEANETMKRDEASILFLLRSYVVARETINHQDDAERIFGQVANMSSELVFEVFRETAQSGPLAKLYQDEQFTRSININSSIFVGDVSNKNVLIDFTTIEHRAGAVEERNWRVSISFEFADEYKKIEDMTFNPLGVYITNYTISAYATK